MFTIKHWKKCKCISKAKEPKMCSNNDVNQSLSCLNLWNHMKHKMILSFKLAL